MIRAGFKELLRVTTPDVPPQRSDMLVPALMHSYATQCGMTGVQLLGGDDMCLLALLEMSTDHRIPVMDRVYAQEIVNDTMIRQSIEQARVKHTAAQRA